MKISGLQKMTLLDYPGKIACTVFLGGCNFRCPFCHNGSLVVPSEISEFMSEDEFFAFLDSRVGRLEGVCISGGEPTLTPNLADFIRKIKEKGFSVKLDTNGSRPEVLGSLIDENLLDYVAMDIKNSPENYGKTVGLNSEFGIRNSKLNDEEGNFEFLDKIKASAEILMEGRVDFEFRTTLCRELHSEGDIEAIGKWLFGDEKFFLQSYRDEGDLLLGGFSAYTEAERRELLQILKKYFPNADLRL